ncbi:MAG: hypothetical protein MZV64_27755 [Ignavibacteriales bacterium]|nr:hypothetical protein [Ignavibacteriales bacterium]
MQKLADLESQIEEKAGELKSYMDNDKAAALVISMQIGFLFLEAGISRSKQQH